MVSLPFQTATHAARRNPEYRQDCSRDDVSRTSTIIWIEYLRSHFREQTRKIILWAIIAPILMSGIIELAQEYCTEARSGEWADFAANSTGVVLAALLGHFVLRRHIHPKNKDNDSKEQGGRARD